MDCVTFFVSLHQIVLSVKIIEVVDALERFAPLPLQEDYDNAGLQVGLTEAEVSGALTRPLRKAVILSSAIILSFFIS